MAGELRDDPDALGPQLVPEPEAEVARAESQEMMAGPGMVAPPGMWRGWVLGGLVGMLIGAGLGAAMGAIVWATSSAAAWWIIAVAAIGAFAGGTVGFMLGAPFDSLKYDQGARAAEQDDGGPIAIGPDEIKREAHEHRHGWHGSGHIGTSH
jgi:hypothetical protein